MKRLHQTQNSRCACIEVTMHGIPPSSKLDKLKDLRVA